MWHHLVVLLDLPPMGHGFHLIQDGLSRVFSYQLDQGFETFFEGILTVEHIKSGIYSSDKQQSCITSSELHQLLAMLTELCHITAEVRWTLIF